MSRNSCPECSAYLRAGAKSCRCGWSAGDGPVSKEVACDYCSDILPFPGAKQSSSMGRRIIGRSRAGGFICGQCYERGETFDYRDKAFTDFHERHKDDEWGAIIGATYQLKGAPREDFIDVLGILKALARKYGGAFGALPYDPEVREPARPEYEPGMSE